MKALVPMTAAALAFTSFSATAGVLTEDKIREAQNKWAQGIVRIGEAKLGGGDYRSEAQKLLDSLYDYNNGEVLFKPTKAKNDQFRETFEEAHSYFVTGVVEEDDGFAINPWKQVRFDNHDIMIHDDFAVAMGNYFFTTLDEQEVKVEYTFGYRLDEQGDLKIVLHHSSLPFGS